MRISRAAPILLAVIFALTAGAGAKLWLDVVWSPAPGWAPQTLERQARAIWAAGPKPSAAQLARAEQLTRAELAFAPQNAAVWCRLAYGRTQVAGRLDAQAAQSLRRCYRYGPFAADVFLWRTEFVFENWQDAPADIRALALRETRAFYSIWAQREKIELMAARIRNPSGRLAMELVLMRASPVPSA